MLKEAIQTEENDARYKSGSAERTEEHQKL